jgi:hypothetical protein
VTWIDGTGYVVFPIDAVNGVRCSFCHPLQNDKGQISQTTTARDGDQGCAGVSPGTLKALSSRSSKKTNMQ